MNLEAKLRHLLETFGKRSFAAAEKSERLAVKISGPQPRPEQGKNAVEKPYPNDLHAIADELSEVLHSSFVRIEEALEWAHSSIGQFAPEVTDKVAYKQGDAEDFRLHQRLR